jgi:uncharacterized protein (DUF2267 family)
MSYGIHQWTDTPMPKHHVSAWSRTLQISHEWLADTMDELGTDDPQRAYAALRAGLQALRDRLMPDQAVHLGAQLPTLLRGVYYDGWTLEEPRLKTRSEAEFLNHVAMLLDRPDIDPALAIRAAFHVIDRHVTGGEVENVLNALPRPLARLLDAH